jgi:sugar lactone lactonase YvrE
MTQPATTKTVGQRRPRRRWVAAAVTGFSLITASIVAGAVATPGQILALPGASESTVVTVNPTRVLDTRYNVGLAGQLQSTVSRKLAITGKIPTYVEATATTAAVTTNKVVIPVGATGVIMNVTAVSPTSAGFLSIRPGDATGVPATAGLNFAPGNVVPNAVTVAIPTTGANAGQIDIHYGGKSGNTMHVIIDIVGYTTSTGLIDLVNRVTALETSGVKGDKGDPGTNGDDGTNGEKGDPGTNGPVEGSVCVAGGVNGTIVTSFNTVDGLMNVTCRRPAGEVITLAGTADSDGEDNANGISASFNNPTGVAVDESGNVYVADQSNDLIRKISPTGDVTTLAGNPTWGAVNGNGTSASFDFPSGVAVDGSGYVYVADKNNSLIRKISPTGDVTTLAGTGNPGAVNGNGTLASFNFPNGVAVDGSGNVYVADKNNHLIRKISPTGDVTTLAGTGNPGAVNGNGTLASFNFPYGVAVDGSGNVYVADQNNHLIRKISPTGDVTTLAGTGSPGAVNGNGTLASFNNPAGVAVDGSGNVYVADKNNSLIRKIF